MRILFIGDIVGSPGRRIVAERVADLIETERLDLVIANGENSASGFGITPRIVEELLTAGVEVISGGNHSWDRKEILDFFPHEPRLLRPANFPAGSPGSGMYHGHRAERDSLCCSVPAGSRFHGSQRLPFSHGGSRTRKASPARQGDRHGHSCGSHQRETGHGLVSGWTCNSRGGNAHARGDVPTSACCRVAPPISPMWA